MHRLFVGIDPPFDVKDALMEAMGGIIGARWQSEDQLHLTLRFLGERSFREADDIAEALAGVRTRSVAIGIAGVGLFDRRGRPNQLWARVSPPQDATRLHRKVDRALLRIGIPGETRAFLPHITLARFSSGSGPLDDFMVRHGDLKIPTYTADEFCLYESRLTSAGAEYTIVERYPFAQESLFGPSFL
ncbi:RNA 2',3'-cyclic phosphodiesterase [Pacificimonas sp. WHA3]|uniref:RNA 2',3'-cyclic phosphodiesterase n=1 Tax=Pacificimonas pallii TaxID=2827236 RepID=A0ABS6SEP4_9SPHN|nr:RNA 2',3'-cyclic phosphodiesterase [Pacificimonas pallii]MBV7256337.1 RNA 2',3'-cyclic phosphodiesterase [Pacificimonas pallii]